MTNPKGDIIWYELMTPDIEGARAFYKAVADFEIGPGTDMPGMDYRMIHWGDHHAGGAMPFDEHMRAAGALPLWTFYLAVEDVDAKVAAIVADGGHVFVPPRDISNTGRFAMVADPQGAPFYVMRGASEGTSTVFADGQVGHWGWNELWTPDARAAVDFYGKHFGWRQDGVMPMGEMGDYLFIHLGETRLGAIGPKNEPGVRAMWRFYFRVASLGAAIEAIKANGGTVTNGPHEVPGGDHVVVAKDPQGAEFALVGAA